jgi:hypothetical protein
MSLINMTATYTYQGVSYTNGQTYRFRARDAEAIIAAAKATKSPLKK